MSSHLKAWRVRGVVIGLALLTGIGLQAQTFTSLYSFSGGSDGSNPYAAVAQATNGKLYGTTSGGGSHQSGTVFQITTAGALTNVYSFCTLAGCVDGYGPRSAVIQATNGNLYGTTFGGGPGQSPGTIYQLGTSGLKPLYSFCAVENCADGEAPLAALTQAINGVLYGTTTAGGARGQGTVFDIKTSGGALTTLYSFCSLSECADGDSPQATLIQGSDGDLYGTTYDGGTFNYYGTLFKISMTGVFDSLHNFDGTDGDEPIGAMIQATDGNYYGTTQVDGANGYGTVYKLTPGGTLTTIYNFCSLSGCTDGEVPLGGLIQGSDGNLYGTTFQGGANGEGTIFSVTTAGVLTTLHSFDGSDGNQPWAGLMQDTNGTFFGTTYSGGSTNLGTVFSLSVGLKAFVKMQPRAGKVGQTIEILGNNLSSTTSVTFNGVAAKFTVKSSTEITATIPSGAKSGPVKVVTSAGTLTSYPNFIVL